MQEESIVYVFVVVMMPILISIVALLWQMKQDTKTTQKESIEATSKLTEAMVRLTDKIDQLFSDNARQDARLDDHERRIESLENKCVEVQTDIRHYHENKG